MSNGTARRGTTLVETSFADANGRWEQRRFPRSSPFSAKGTHRVPLVTLETDLAKFAFHKPDVVLIAMSCTLSPRTKEWVERAENERGLRIVPWERSELDHRLRRHQVVRRTLFGDPQGDPSTVSHLAKLCRAPEIERVAWESASLTAVRSVLAVGEGIERVLRPSPKYRGVSILLVKVPFRPRPWRRAGNGTVQIWHDRICSHVIRGHLCIGMAVG